MLKVAIGQDSHCFVEKESDKKLVLGGVIIDGCPGLKGNSDADVVLHALTNAISGITCVNILGEISDNMCLKEGITDSRAYLNRALSDMKNKKIIHISISIEALKPKLSSHFQRIRENIAGLTGIDQASVGITATTGEGLTEFGKGNGIFCTVILTVQEFVTNF